MNSAVERTDAWRGCATRINGAALSTGAARSAAPYKRLEGFFTHHVHPHESRIGSVARHGPRVNGKDRWAREVGALGASRGELFVRPPRR